MILHSSLKLIVCLIAIFVVNLVSSVDRSKFRTCNDTGFCRRYRSRAPALGEQFSIFKDSIKQTSPNKISGLLSSTQLKSPLNFELEVISTDTVRLRLIEDSELGSRWQPPDILLPYSSGQVKFLSSDDPLYPQDLKSMSNDDCFALEVISSESNAVLVILNNPFSVRVYFDNVLVISLNERSLLHYEQRQSKSDVSTQLSENSALIDRHGGKEVVDYGEDGLATYADGTKEERKIEDNEVKVSESDWTEMFGGHKDTRPYGPMSMGVDISFPFAQHVYGIPEHTTPLSLPTTQISSAQIPPHYSEPYRLYNLDVFEYEIDQTMALYGHIPFLMAHGLINGIGNSVGVFWFNPSETFVDISDGGVPGNPHKESHWLLESGMFDIFLFLGPQPAQVQSQMTRLTGRQELPPIFALGYHQCRWNYRDERDVAAVERGFEDLDYPMDVIWLDIEHTDGKRYFTWDRNLFPNPIEMQRNVSSHGRRMVTIVDPHIKRDSNYRIHQQATELNLYIKDNDGSTTFNGWCWPGDSSYLDFTDSTVRNWWAEQFSLDKYIGSSLDLFTWNDMNEPSVFNGPEVSMRKDTRNLQGIEHREWHNLYGLYMQRATGEGLIMRASKSSEISGSITEFVGSFITPSAGRVTSRPRPFVLSRAFWAGSQRYGAIWTGDNSAQWSHFKIASPMLLSINLAGLSFAGADVGGFFGDPDAELFTRWYQAAAFTPFFRGHAHHDSKRREPWVYGEPYTSILRAVAMIRYSLLPYWYSTFYEAYSQGVPVMRTLFTEFPNDVRVFALDDQWMVGKSLLVKPVTDPGASVTTVYLPGVEPWYCFHTLQRYDVSIDNFVKMATPLEVIPVFIRGGSIIPRKLRLRRSSKLMFHDPYTLVVVLDSHAMAVGSVYMDDETSLDHEDFGKSTVRYFKYFENTLSCYGIDRSNFNGLNTVERVIIVGLVSAPTRVEIVGKDIDLESSYDSELRVLTVKKPDLNLTDDWVIRFWL